MSKLTSELYSLGDIAEKKDEKHIEHKCNHYPKVFMKTDSSDFENSRYEYNKCSKD